MSSPFHPELRRRARLVPRHIIGPRSLRPLRFVQSLADRRRPPSGVELERWGPVEVRVHRPPRVPGPTRPGVLWIHGGGHVIGSPSQDDRWCREMSERLGAVVAAVRYRLAPEHPHPAALLDCHQALVELAGQPDVDGNLIAIAGASAGGGLAAGLAILAAERGEVTPVLQVLGYPMLDDRTVLRRSPDPRQLRLWGERSNEFGWRSHLGRAPGSADVASTAAPARHHDLSGLAPAWIGVGTVDLFYDEDLAYADRLRAAGVACDVFVVEGAFHGFDAVAPRARVTRSFRDAQIDVLADAFGSESGAPAVAAGRP